jgi:hypothetical protein
LEAREEPAPGRHRVRHRFRNWAGTFDVMGRIPRRSDAGARFWWKIRRLRSPGFSFTLEGVSAGAWTEKAVRICAGQAT